MNKYTTNGNEILACGAWRVAVCNDENTALILMHALNRDIEAQLIENTMILPSREWERITGIEVIDPDGWKNEDEWSDPISLLEFKDRCMVSTIRDPKNALGDKSMVFSNGE